MAVLLRRVTQLTPNSTRLFGASANLLSGKPHGGEGTAFKDRETAVETAYIHKQEEELLLAKAKKVLLRRGEHQSSSLQLSYL